MPEQPKKQPRKTASTKKRAPRTNSPKSAATKSATPKSRKRSTARKPVRTTRPTADQIRDRAYFLYVERGRTNGDDQADWYRAEQELLEADAG